MLMLQRNSTSLFAIVAAIALITAIPVLGQDKPESILPPGFGEPDVKPPPKGRDDGDDVVTRRPTDLVPDLPLSQSPAASRPSQSTSKAGLSDVLEQADQGDESNNDETVAVAPVLMDIPPAARRSTTLVGILNTTDGDMGINAFSGTNGRYLSKLMRNIDAPIASRWASIVLRRALLTRSQTPQDVNGADWVAERAWLLLRMGEADSARMLIQSVDVDQFTPKMFEVAMQAALATADPAALCSMTDHVGKSGTENAWILAKAMCASMGGESGQAAALLDRARDKLGESNIDVLLAEKVTGATNNTRRAVNVQWDDVRSLSAWRFGLASATGLEIPERLMKTVGPQARAWQARLPLLQYDKRIAAADHAAALGVLSSQALVDFYGTMMDEADVAERSGKSFESLRMAYIANTVASRVAAMQTLWTVNPQDPEQRYAHLLLTARAAARVPASSDFSTDMPMLIASMLSAGLDTRADEWVAAVDGAGNAEAWGLLAVGSTRTLAGISEGKIDDFGSAASVSGKLKSQFLFAGLAGLGRIDAAEIGSMAESLDVPIGRANSWTRGLERAVETKAPATVALLCAIGLQSGDWKDIPPSHLFHIVSSLRQVGFEAEARMIAAEALMRT
jgi:hypothetical protein